MFKRVFLTISLLMAVTLAQEYTPVISYDLNPDPNLEFAVSDLGITVQQDFGEFDTDLFRVTTEGGYFDFTGLAVNDIVGNGTSVFTDGGCDVAYANGPGGWGPGYVCNADLDTELEVVVRLSSFPPPGDPNDYINCDIVIVKSNNPLYFNGMQPAGLVARNRDVVRTIVGVQVDVAFAAGGDPGATTQGYTSLVNLASLFHNPAAGDMMVTADFFPEVGPNITDVQYIPISFIDCNGVLNGSAVIDDCGDCVEGDTGLAYNNAMDDCGVCDGGNADMDCAGVCFGTAYLDSCGACVGGTTGLAEGYAIDCNGDCFGTAIVDDCGDCTEGNTGLSYNGAQDACGICYGSNTDDGSGFITGPDADCAGVCFGESSIDDCGNCVLPADFNNAMDCNGDCDGTAFIDDCGVCSEGMTGHTANSDQDCAGVCFGESTIDDCGDCVLPADFNGAMDCNDECYGTAFIDACGICAEGSTGLTANIDDGSGFVTGPDADCNGDCFGTAYLDDCGVCSEGNSGHTANSDKDCNGDCFGTAYIDDCQICAEGNTGLAPNVDDGSGFVTGPDADCNGDCFGTAYLDDCGVCSEGNSGHTADSDKDCNGDCFGTAYIDDCQICAEGNTGLAPNVDDGSGFVTGPDADCNGDCFGTAYLDDCDVCSEGNTGHMANSDQDCAGTCFGDAFMQDYYYDVDADGIGEGFAANECNAFADPSWVTNTGDNCPADYNPEQTDTDGDGEGDVCDATPYGECTLYFGGFDVVTGDLIIKYNCDVDVYGYQVTVEGTPTNAGETWDVMSSYTDCMTSYYQQDGTDIWTFQGFHNARTDCVLAAGLGDLVDIGFDPFGGGDFCFNADNIVLHDMGLNPIDVTLGDCIFLPSAPFDCNHTYNGDVFPVDFWVDNDADGLGCGDSLGQFCPAGDACEGYEGAGCADPAWVTNADDPCCSDPDNDIDEDGVCGDVDNCPAVYNPDQNDWDQDGPLGGDEDPNTGGDVCDATPWGDVNIWFEIVDSYYDYDLEQGVVVIDYNSNVPIWSFMLELLPTAAVEGEQFVITDVVSPIADFNTSWVGTNINGFPAPDYYLDPTGTLITVYYEPFGGGSLCFGDAQIYTDFHNNPLAVTTGDCVTLDSAPMDCAGIYFGVAELDSCDVCSGGTTGHVADSDIDDCGVCFGGNADMDCNGDCGEGTPMWDGGAGGTAFVDDCGECVSGNTGADENWAMDCNGDCFGTAVIDDCGYCVEGNTGLAFDYADLGCGCDNPAPVDYCFDFDGDGLGGIGSEVPYCLDDVIPDGWVLDCTDPYDDGEVNLYFGNLDTSAPGNTGTVDILYDSDVDIYGWQFIITDLPVVSGVPGPDGLAGGFSVQVNPGTGGVIGFTLTSGAYPAATGGLLATLTFNYGPDVTACITEPVVAGAPGHEPFTTVGPCIDVLEPWADCAGTYNGPLLPDCNGDCDGTAFIDDCGVCSEGNSGHTANSDMDMCDVCFGDAFSDYDGDGLYHNDNFEGCDPYPFGDANLYFGDIDPAAGTVIILIDNNMPVYGFEFDITNLPLVEGIGEGYNPTANFGIDVDNNTVSGYSNYGAFIPAGVGNIAAILNYYPFAGGGETCILPTPPASMPYVIDNNLNEFGVTVGPCVPIPECNQDCNGDWCGEAFLDDCEVCSGGNTGHEANSDDLGCGCFEPAALNYCSDFDGDGLGTPGTEASYCWFDVPDGWVEDCTDPYPDGEATVYFGAVSQCEGDFGTLDVLYDSDVDLYGFQFNFGGLDIVSASTTNPDFQVQFNPINGQVVGFSITGGFYPAAAGGVLATLSFNYGPAATACLADVIVAGEPGHSPNATAGDCADIPEPMMDCAGTYCGDAVDLGCGCNEPAAETYCYDWDGDGLGGVGTDTEYCLGSVPDGWVGDCSDLYDDGEVTIDFGEVTRVDNGTIDVTYSSDVDLYGFQFVVTGIDLVSASTSNPDFQVQINPGNNQVLGFSISGGIYPAGDGVLVTLTYAYGPDATACLEQVIIAGSAGHAPNVTVGDCILIPEPWADCNGVYYGEAYVDDCGECVGGDTGMTENWAMDDCGVCFGENADMDCAGVCFGESVVDDCGDCVLPENFNAGMDDCGVCYGDNADMDCAGVCFGESSVDDCGDCVLPEDFNGAMDDCGVCYGDNADMDCAGVCFGYSVVDDCGDCVLPEDFNGAMDDCGVCYGDNADIDCAGVCFGESVVDDCGDCVLPENFNAGMDDCGVCYGGNADMDCAGVCFGESVVDDCGDCVLPENFNSGMDDCGVCYGDNADMDCAGVCFGESVVDDCGDCVLPDDFDAAMDDCGVCYGDNSSCTGCMDDSADNFDETATIPCDGCCEYSYSIDLHAGSNLISFYALPDDGSLGNVLSGLQGNVFGVIAEGSAAQPNPIDPSSWIGSLTGFDVYGGYWLKLNSSDVLDIFHGPYSGDITYDLHSGSNLISYSYDTPQLVPDALPADFASHVLGIIGEGTATQPHPVNPGEWIGTLTSFEPTKGYWFKMDAATAFAYNAPALTRNIAPVALPAVPAEYSYTQSEDQAFYFVNNATINGRSLSANDWIIAYNGDVVVGARQWNNGSVDVPAMGHDHNLGLQTAGYCESGDIPSFKVLVAETNELVDMVAGDVPAWNINGIFTVNDLTSAVEIPDQVTLKAAYPNPFNPVTTIGYSLPNEMDVTVTVIDMTGRTVETLVNGVQSNGYHTVAWNANEQASGIYFIKLVTNDAVEIQKVMLVK